MKNAIKFLIPVFLAVFLISCNSKIKKNSSNLSIDIIKAIEIDNCQITYFQGEFCDKDWNNPIGTCDYDVIPDAETAYAIAWQYFLAMPEASEYSNYAIQSIFLDAKDKIWIVTFTNSQESITVGNDCSIAIRQSDGQVLRIWFGE